MKRKKLSTSDLLKRQRESGGFGLYGHEVRTPMFWCGRSEDPYLAARFVDECAIEVANRLKFDEQNFFDFMNSKLGRLVGDEIARHADRGPLMLKTIVEEYMRRFSRASE